MKCPFVEGEIVVFNKTVECEVFKSEYQAESGKGSLEKIDFGEEADVISINEGETVQVQFGNGEVAIVNWKHLSRPLGSKKSEYE